MEGVLKMARTSTISYLVTPDIWIFIIGSMGIRSAQIFLSISLGNTILLVISGVYPAAYTMAALLCLLPDTVHPGSPVFTRR